MAVVFVHAIRSLQTSLMEKPWPLTEIWASIHAAHPIIARYCKSIVLTINIGPAVAKSDQRLFKIIIFLRVFATGFLDAHGSSFVAVSQKHIPPMCAGFYAFVGASMLWRNFWIERNRSCDRFAIVTPDNVYLSCQKQAPKPDADSNRSVICCVVAKGFVRGTLMAFCIAKFGAAYKLMKRVEMVKGEVSKSCVRCCHHGICDSDWIPLGYARDGVCETCSKVR